MNEDADRSDEATAGDDLSARADEIREQAVGAWQTRPPVESARREETELAPEQLPPAAQKSIVDVSETERYAHERRQA